METSNQNKLSPELRKMLDFTTPYKVLVNKKSWNQHNSKNNVNTIEKLPEKQNESRTSDRKVWKIYQFSEIDQLVKIDQFSENIISICEN